MNFVKLKKLIISSNLYKLINYIRAWGFFMFLVFYVE
jgi:hypothetical protein